MNWAEKLNEKQLEAVTCTYQHVRVVAGAGSGKTRVLTYRIAYLIDEFQVKPWSILAFTFTNKVAAEMKDRVVALIPECSKYLNIRTFHSFAAYFLRQEIKVLNYPSTFTILDEEDQLKLIKDIAFEMGFSKGAEIVKHAMGYIGACKLKEKYPQDVKVSNIYMPDESDCLEIYKRYEESKNKMFALDFDDLLLYTNYILANYSDIRHKWQDRIDHILIDEFQDTNDTEFKLVTMLKKPMASLYVVGDPDQTIYTWRGANQEIILKLDTRFPDMETIILDQNYRSTQTILNSANALIAHNKLRVKKDLFTENSGGDPILVKSLPSSKDEAEYVAKEILRLKASGKYCLRDITLLYRSNYLTVDFEHAFMSYHIPYKIFGGQKFYQRREVKDVLAYFHLITNVKDDISFERIINVPRRGIGETSIAALKVAARERNLSLYEFISFSSLDESPIKKNAFNVLKTLVTRIDLVREDIKKNEEIFSKTLEDFISEVGYYEYLLKEDDGDDRLENVKALFQDLRHYLKQNPEATFEQYLQDIALLSSQDEVIDGDFVTLMTVHTAKGLEFPIVFLIRFNDNVFPNARALGESGYKGMEEERRLAYVAFTRAKEKLYVTCCNDYSYVVRTNLVPSCFIKEAQLKVPESTQRPFFQRDSHGFKSYHFQDDDSMPEFDDNFYLKKDKPKPAKEVEEIPSTPITNDIVWNVGDKLTHTKFGEGTILSVDGDNIIVVEFKDHGKKTLMGNHKALSKIN